MLSCKKTCCQSIIKKESDIEKAYNELNNARGSSSRIIIEEFIEFDYEITIITIKQQSNIYYCEPIIHRQKNGDFYLSYQYNKIVSDKIREKCNNICNIIVNELCTFNDNGIFGIEFFVRGDDVIFNEIAPRCHDTGYITLKTQNISQFDLLI